MASYESGDRNGLNFHHHHDNHRLQMLFNPVYWDVKLIVGPNQVEFPAHKVILANNSVFFKNMFNFDHDKEPPSVKFPDAEPISFRLFIMYLYSNDFGDLLKEPNMNILSVAFDVLKLAKVYFVEPLVDLILGHIDKMKTMANVLSIICVYDQLDLKKEKAQAYTFARRNFYQVAQSEEWKHLPRKFVQDFMDDSEMITTNEVEIIKALKSWGEAQCSNMTYSSNQEETNVLELRQVLKGLVELIRYKRMSSKEFATHVIPLEILTVEQEHKIFANLAISNLNDRSQSQNKECYYCWYKGEPICGNCGNYKSDDQEPETEKSSSRAADKRIL